MMMMPAITYRLSTGEVYQFEMPARGRPNRESAARDTKEFGVNGQKDSKRNRGERAPFVETLSSSSPAISIEANRRGQPARID
jgi:hypothetical protein